MSSKQYQISKEFFITAYESFNTIAGDIDQCALMTKLAMRFLKHDLVAATVTREDLDLFLKADNICLAWKDKIKAHFDLEPELVDFKNYSQSERDVQFLVGRGIQDNDLGLIIGFGISQKEFRNKELCIPIKHPARGFDITKVEVVSDDHYHRIRLYRD